LSAPPSPTEQGTARDTQSSTKQTDSQTTKEKRVDLYLTGARWVFIGEGEKEKIHWRKGRDSSRIGGIRQNEQKWGEKPSPEWHLVERENYWKWWLRWEKRVFRRFIFSAYYVSWWRQYIILILLTCLLSFVLEHASIVSKSCLIFSL